MRHIFHYILIVFFALSFWSCQKPEQNRGADNSAAEVPPASAVSEKKAPGSPEVEEPPDPAVVGDGVIPLLLADGNKIPPGPYLWGPKERPWPGLVIGQFTCQGEDAANLGAVITDLLKRRISFTPEAFIPIPRNRWVPYLYSFTEDEDLNGTGDEDLEKAVKAVGEDYGLVGTITLKDDGIQITGRLYSREADKFREVFNLYGGLDEISVLLGKAVKAVVEGMGVEITEKQRKFIDRPFPKDWVTLKRLAGIWMLEDGSLDDFVQNWKRLRDDNQDDDYICASYGNVLSYKDRLEAIKYFQQMRVRFPGYDYFHLRKISYMMDEHLDELCLGEVKSYLGKNPTDLWALLDLRTIYMRKRQWPRMYGAALRYLYLVPDSYLGHSCVGEAAYEYAWGKRGGGYRHKVSKEGKHSFPIMVRVSRILYARSLEIWPENAWNWVQMINVYKSTGTLADMERAFNKAIEYQPNSSTAYHNFIQCFTPGWNDDRERAQALWEEARDKYPDSHAMAMLPIRYLEMYARNVERDVAARDPWFREQKEKTYKHAAYISESSDQDITRYAQYLTELERYDEAIVEFKRIMADGKLEYPSGAEHEYYVRYAEVLSKIGQKEKAIQNYELCLQNGPCDDCRYASLQQLGKLYGETADFEKSMDYYHKTIKFRPNSDYARHNFAYFAPRAEGFLEKKEFEKLMEEAEGYARALVDKDPNNDIYLLTLAKVMYVKGERGDALDIIDEAIEKSGGKEGYKKMRQKMEKKEDLWPWLKKGRE